MKRGIIVGLILVLVVVGFMSCDPENGNKNENGETREIAAELIGVYRSDVTETEFTILYVELFKNKIEFYVIENEEKIITWTVTNTYSLEVEYEQFTQLTIFGALLNQNGWNNTGMPIGTIDEDGLFQTSGMPFGQRLYKKL
jgi:hypothetical protein